MPMAYNDMLAARIRDVLAPAGIEEKKMFGGIAFMLNGNMVCGVIRDDLMVRVGPGKHEMALTRLAARPMDFAGRPMRGMVFVSPVGYETDAALRDWIDLAMSFGSSLPVKVAKPRARKAAAK
jgi:hypothetical protein